MRQARETPARAGDRRLGLLPLTSASRIEGLTSHGFSPGAHHRVGSAMERELALLFAEKSTPVSLTQEQQVARLDGGTFEVEAGSAAEAIGTQLAQAVYGSLS